VAGDRAMRMNRGLAPKRGWNWRSQAFRGLLFQLLVVALAVLGVWYLAQNTVANMQVRGIRSGFDFLAQPGGFDIGETLIAYDPLQPIWRAFLVGILNTLRVAVIGIVLATILGTLIGIGRFSRNAIVRGLCYAYVEWFRNIPVLLQLLVWYLLFAEYLPPLLDAPSIGGVFYLSKAGLSFPIPVWGEGGFAWSIPRPEGFVMEGGVSASPEFMAVLLGLVMYTSAFIAEVVRAGLASVPRGQVEAAASLGLPRGRTIRLVIMPQALRVIIPPLTSQYLNLTKNSSLAVAIGYPDVVSIATTALNNTGRAVECIAIVMAVFLTTSLSTSVLMNWYNRRAAIKER
jgi:general L-amino acid transport system permease protein